MENRTLWLRLLVVLVTLVVPAAALAADCPDGDGDTYVTCSGCTAGAGTTCGDCAEGNPAIHPGAPEQCGDTVDSNCDGYDFAQGGHHTGQSCVFTTGPADECVTSSVFACTGVSSLACKVPLAGILQWQDESGAAANCYDGVDNDCDGFEDTQDSACQTAETCDGLDNDGDGLVDEDFLALGTSCTAGIGACQRIGINQCTANHLTTTCSVTAGSPGLEAVALGSTCSDLVDNDCDGSVDVADTGCQQPEKCDGIDNDGNGIIDEGFAGLGDPCTAGVGACSASGQVVCRGDGLGTQCNAIAGLPSAEGPAGATCGDGIDNDCDGQTDVADAGCGSAAIATTCRLVPVVDGRGKDVETWRFIHFDVSGAAPGAQVTAELLALAPNGSVLGSLPVHDGDVAHLFSRVKSSEWNWETLPASSRVRLISGIPLLAIFHEVIAPVPMLRITVKDGFNESQAYCSIQPYLDVVKPSNEVLTGADGDTIKVLSSIPHNDPKSVHITLDGVNVLAALGINPATSFPGGPFGGVIDVNGTLVTISNLVVQAPATDDPRIASSNTVRMDLTSAGCGSHVVSVTSSQFPPRPLGGGARPVGGLPSGSVVTPPPNTYIDDLSDRAMATIFKVEITNPTAGEVTSQVPTPVEGHVCGGREIAGLKINGKSLSTSGQSVVHGNGVDSGDLVSLDFQTTLDRTNLALDFDTGDGALGTLDAGSNRLVAEATDDLGNRTFSGLFFATGQVANPAASALAALLSDSSLRSEARSAFTNMMVGASSSRQTDAAVNIDNAFVVGMSPQAVQAVFNKKCATMGQTFANKVREKVQAADLGSISIEPACSCDINVPLRVSAVNIDPNQTSCVSTFEDGKIRVVANLPDIEIVIRGNRSCTETFLGACIDRTVVDITATTRMRNNTFTFDITEGQLLGTAAPGAGEFKVGVVDKPTEANGLLQNNSRVECIGADICNAFAVVAQVFIDIVTFGTVDGGQILPLLSIDSNLNDFKAEVGASEPDPVKLDEIKMDEEVVAAYDQTQSGTLTSVRITPQGLIAGLRGSFSTTLVDPEVAITPGSAIRTTPLPVAPVPNADDLFVMPSENSYNMMFASMTAGGRLKTSCQPTGKTVGDMVPANCEDLVITLDTAEASDAATAAARGICYAVRGVDCETLSVVSRPLLTGIQQGACHGFRGDICDTLPVAAGLPGLIEGPAEKATCTATPATNLTASQGVLFCSRQDVPPALKITDNPSTTGKVETKLRLNDLSMALIVDREGNGLQGTLSALPKCFAKGSPTVGDCALYEICLDLNLITELELLTCSDGNPGIAAKAIDLQVLNRQPGVVCSAGPAGDDTQVIDQSESDDVSIDAFKQRVDDFTPPLCAKGLTLGGTLNFLSPHLISSETDGDPAFQEFLGITGHIAP